MDDDKKPLGMIFLKLKFAVLMNLKLPSDFE